MVSVLLAAYEGAQWLPAQLDSLRAQTCTDFRVLWQDDGSADGSRELLQRLSAEDARFIPGRSQGQRLGAIGNFLSLMAQDDAPCSALCDQDDLWQPDKLARCMDALREAEERFGADTPLLVHHDCRVVGPDGHVLHESFFRHQGWDGCANTLPRLLVQNNVTGCTCVMNAALRRIVTQYAQAETIFMHDWFIALTAAAFGQIVFVDEPLVDYRQHGRNVMGASRATLLQRGLAALRSPQHARERIALTFRQARMLRQTFGSALPSGAADIVDRYLAIEALPRWQRAHALRTGGYLMQSPVTRIGQYLFT
ncbi:MAG: glycosyltransferase family 2 protein [Clostridia bacterium]|nr:glycosyltransferase family 2 protein [Clostridia bacterium]